ncbi:hypothetical protein PLANTIT3_10047 [Plantibacter sp. T3]|nr:hypothetical protein PLANTIT3_10047 [Plantibacter sp. T3]
MNDARCNRLDWQQDLFSSVAIPAAKPPNSVR